MISYHRLKPSKKLEDQYDTDPAFKKLAFPDFEFCFKETGMDKDDYKRIEKAYS